jgi:thiamine biosynthesis lipoprotein
MSVAQPHTFDAMGTRVAVWIDHGDAALRQETYALTQRTVAEWEVRLTRFDPASELSRVNQAVGAPIQTSPEFAQWLASALWAAEWTDGMVDPTLGRQIETAGYRTSLTPADDSSSRDKDRRAAEMDLATRFTKPARPAWPALWRSIELDPDRATVKLPVGVKLDSGGTGKGFITDRVAEVLNHRLDPGTRWWLDSGGDIRLSDLPLGAAPHLVEIEHPLSGEHTHRVTTWGGAVATSSIARRAWRNADGAPAHHLLDPATGRPAWTGLVAVTAIGTCALQAETLAKWALLAGPAVAHGILRRRGGLIFHQSGSAEPINIARPVSRPIPRRSRAKTTTSQMEAA